MREALQRWWQGREQREQHWLLLGAAVVLGFVLYSALWQPYWQWREQQWQRYHYNRHLVTWMSGQVTAIKQLQHQRHRQQSLDRTSLLAQVDSSLRQHHLEGYQPTLKQNDTGALTVSFTKIGFDPLIAWLAAFEQQYSVSTQTLTIRRLPAVGEVSAVLVLVAN